MSSARVTAKAMELVVMMALPLVVYFIIYAREAILVLSGADYIPAIIPMQLIMPTVFLIGFTNITGIQILIPQGKGECRIDFGNRWSGG